MIHAIAAVLWLCALFFAAVFGIADKGGQQKLAFGISLILAVLAFILQIIA